MSGYRVQLLHTGEVVGMVVDLLSQPGNAHLLTAVQPCVLQPYGFAGEERHFIPVTPEFIPYVDTRQRVLFITPPQGVCVCVWHLHLGVCMCVCGGGEGLVSHAHVISHAHVMGHAHVVGMRLSQLT